MIKYNFNNGILYHADNIEVLKSMDENSVDSVVTDPPYGWKFMGKKWDYDIPSVDLWKEVYRVLKPGGYILVACGTKTQHRMACNIEDAGFEIKDIVSWLYGCLSEDTQILTKVGWKYHYELMDSDSVACFDIDTDEYSFYKPLNRFLYDNKHTAYTIKSDTTDQLVSRNHRCIVERDGRKVFVYAEALQSQESVPILESLQDLPDTIYDYDDRTSISKQDLLKEVCFKNNSRKSEADCIVETKISSLQNVRERIFSKKSIEESKTSILFENLCWKSKRLVKIIFKQQCWEEMPKQGCSNGEKSFLERWNHIFKKTRKLFANKICEMSRRIYTDGSERWICYGTSISNGEISEQMFNECGSCASYKSQSTRQSNREFDAIPQQQRTQTVRISVGEVEYAGKMWCVEVPTGAFVARRNGMIFITGNSGMPKGLNIGNAIEKKLGKERKSSYVPNNKNKLFGKGMGGGITDNSPAQNEFNGFNTALKPAQELFTLAQKPISEKTIVDNVIKWGTGGMNIDACRIPTDEVITTHSRSSQSAISKGIYGDSAEQETHQKSGQELGRFPANVIIDDSEEVNEEFKKFGIKKSGKMTSDHKRHTDASPNGIYGAHGIETPLLNTYADEGLVSRFFYCAKVSQKERNEGLDGMEKKDAPASARSKPAEGRKSALGSPRENHHPTVKPIALMRYLIKLITPPNGIVLDCFAGSGTTGIASVMEGKQFILMELEADYIKIIENRLKHWEGVEYYERT